MSSTETQQGTDPAAEEDGLERPRPEATNKDTGLTDASADAAVTTEVEGTDQPPPVAAVEDELPPETETREAAATEEPPGGEAADGPEAVEEDEAESGEGAAQAVPPPLPEGAEPAAAAEVEQASPAAVVSEQEAKKRRRLLITLAAVLLLLACVSVMFWRYLRQPVPLPELLPVPARLNYPPHYLFSIYGVERPVGVAVSPDGKWIYAAETGGERLVKIFDRDGVAQGSFAPPRTTAAQRSPVYVAVSKGGRVFVTDRLQRAVFIYDLNGEYLDAILGPDLTLSEYAAQKVSGLQPEAALAYNLFETVVHCRQAGQAEQTLPAPGPAAWAPLGIRVDGADNLLITDVTANRHAVRQIPADVLADAPCVEFDPPEILFGSLGQSNEELTFPNVAVVDSLQRIYVTDGNNGRISVWGGPDEFLFSFGRGIGEGALGLPRGAVMDGRDRLHVVDAVEQKVKVYDVSGAEPEYLFAFGDWGNGDGLFNFPNDIALDATGRLYIADRENNRIQVWSY